MPVDVVRAGEEDWPRLWPVWHATVAAGDTYAYPPDTTSDAARRLWLLPAPAETWLAADGGSVLGTYLLRPNAAGPGDHVANAGFMVAADARRGGIGRLLAEHCLDRARELGYQAMVFNAVVASNTDAVRLWRSLGFVVVGTIPRAFRHPQHGLVDQHVMHRYL